jgi:hypothetical protein
MLKLSMGTNQAQLTRVVEITLKAFITIKLEIKMLKVIKHPC